MWYRKPSSDAVSQVAACYRVRLSLCMIVRNNERTLKACLESIRPWVDEMVIVDTGSTDATPEIAKACGARLFHFPWCDDFSAARNESLRHACGEWLFWMDSDDTIDAENGRKLRDLANSEHEPRVLGHIMQVHCPSADWNSSGDVTVVDHVKLFRNLPGLRFDFRIHEQLLPSIRRLGGQVAWTDLFVVHSGSDHSAEGRQRKCERDFRILTMELAERPDHPFALFNLGMTCEDVGRYDEACLHLRRCLELSDPNDSHVRKAFALLVSSLTHLNQLDEAWQVCKRGREQFPEDVELAFRQGVLAHQMGRIDDAVTAYLAALDSRESRHFSSLDPGVSGHKARHNLALVYRDSGRNDLAECQCRNAVQESPRYGPSRRLLIEILLEQNKLVAAEIELEKMNAFDHLHDDTRLLRVDLAERTGEPAVARRMLEDSIQANPQSKLLLERLCRHLFHFGPPEDAERSLLRLIERDPSDGASQSNLGTLYYSIGQLDKAEKSLRESLRLRPDSANVSKQLANVLAARGHNESVHHTLPEGPLVQS